MRKPGFLVKLVFMAVLTSGPAVLLAQPTFPENGVADPRHGHYAFTNATIVKDAGTTLTNATMIIRDGKVEAIGTGLKVPAGVVEVDLKGKYIYPSFIDMYADYGTITPQRAPGGFNFGGQSQITSATKGPYGWNQAIKSDVDAYKVFAVDDARAKPLREAGFGTVLSHVRDGIARGTGTVVTLADDRENMVILKDRASAHYSFSKGTSTQSYPGSMMGMIALLRQSYLDAQWYKSNPSAEGFNVTLKSWNENSGLPQIFDANDLWNDLRADRIGDEFGVQYIIKGGGNEYQRMREVKATNASFIIGLNYPQPQDVEDPNDARFVSLKDLKHWELAPTNPAALEKAGVPFALTTADLRNVNLFWANLRKAMEYGLSEAKAMEALTKTPATLLGIYDKVGSLETGKLANFLVTTGPIFAEKSVILDNYVQGIRYVVRDDVSAIAGTYSVTVNMPRGVEQYTLEVKSAGSGSLYQADTMNTKFSIDGKSVKLSYAPMAKRGRPNMDNMSPGTDPASKTDTSAKAAFTERPDGGGGRGMRGQGGMRGGGDTPLPATATRLSGIASGTSWTGTGSDSSGNPLTWYATLIKLSEPKPDTATKKKEPLVLGEVTYPFEPFGWAEKDKPMQETILIKNATVWTNEKEGVLQNTDVLIKNGKIAGVGKDLSSVGARVIDGTGKHVTPGIIDEHSHIAAASINEGGQSVTSEVRIADNLDPEDINIYRQLSGGVTSSHILHGSANVIGGQTQLIKLRWGMDDDELKFKGWPGQIKFALGENVKRSSSSQGNNRYPDTRMGVEEVLTDAFTRAKDYQKEWKTYNETKNKKGLNAPRRDLELDALVEILENKRFITCHSYVQSEIMSSIEVANRLGYHYNTFTHILEGYKVADKMLAHGANASTFSDWWAYKMEVEDAIPYNAAIMQHVGLNVAINSDDPEMARRLNQEAAKIVKYGGVTEEEALKMVTLNPAKMLHVEDKVGSLKIGKDGDVVLWSDNPLSIYAKSLYTIVDGTVFFDREKDAQLQAKVDEERNRLVLKMNGEKRGGAAVIPAQPSYIIMHTCSEHGHSHGLLVLDDTED